MKLSNIVSETEFTRLSELVPPTSGIAPMAGANTATAPGIAQATQDPAAQAKLQAQQVQQMMQRKKQIQDSIKQKQQEIQDLQKELATIK